MGIGELLNCIVFNIRLNLSGFCLVAMPAYPSANDGVGDINEQLIVLCDFFLLVRESLTI